MNVTKHMVTCGMLMVAMTGRLQAATIDVTGNATGFPSVYRMASNTTWTSNNVYRLMGVIMVPSSVTLTIQPGTVIRGANEKTTGTANRPGMLIIERGGKLYANGTAQHPIIFTDEWDDHNPWATGVSGTLKARSWTYRNGSGTAVDKSDSYDYGKLGDHHGCWGGLVLCGKALVNWDNMTTLGTATIAVEGLDSSLGVVGGGNDDNDSSGEISYVQIRYGGFSLTGTKEINGFTTFGVGRGTKLEHIEVYNNIDDCYEWFGGCVNGKYLIAWGNGDDLFDSDAGFRGVNQFLFGVQRDMGGSKIESGAPDKGMEMDGFETQSASGSFLFSASLWANVTLIGADYNASVRNVALSLRDNATPQIYNSIFMDFGTLGTLIENRTDLTANGVTLDSATRFSTDMSATSSFGSKQTGVALANGNSTLAGLYPNSVSGKQACIRGCEFWNVKAVVDTAVAAGGTALNAKYSWVSSGVGAGPWVDSDKTPFDGILYNSENNVVDEESFTDGGSWTADASNYLPIQKRFRKQVAGNSPVTGYAYPVNAGTADGWFAMEVDPRPANSALYGAVTVPHALVTPTSFRGAFEATNNWAKGWTTIGTLVSTNSANAAIVGVFGATTMANALKVEGDVVSLFGTGTNGTSTVYTNNITTYVTNNITTYVTNNITTYITNTVTVTQTITNGVNGIIYQADGAVNTSGTTVTATGLQTSPVLTFNITSAGTYQLQRTLSLEPVNWTVARTFTVASASSGSPVTVNLTDIIGETPPNSGDARFYRLMKQ